MVCHLTGVEDHSDLIRDPRTDPKPEAVAVEREPDPEPTRSQKAGKPTSGKMARRRKAKREAEQLTGAA